MEMTVREDFDGYWFVANEHGDQEMGGFANEQDAHDWIEMMGQLA